MTNKSPRVKGSVDENSITSVLINTKAITAYKKYQMNAFSFFLLVDDWAMFVWFMFVKDSPLWFIVLGWSLFSLGRLMIALDLTNALKSLNKAYTNGNRGTTTCNQNSLSDN